MILKAFFVVCFYSYFIACFNIITNKNKTVISNETLKSYVEKLFEIKKFEYKRLPKFNGYRVARMCFKKQKQVLYPQLKINQFIYKNLEEIKILDSKLNCCKINFRLHKNAICIQKISKIITKMIIFNKNCNIFKIIHNLRIQRCINKIECKYLFLLIKQEIIKSFFSISCELDFLQCKYKKGELSLEKNINKKNINSSFACGLTNNKNATKIFVKYDINEKELVCEFFKELEFYFDTVCKLAGVFNILNENYKK